MRIGFDAYGGDFGENVTVRAAVQSLPSITSTIVLYGKKEVLEAELGTEKDNPRIEIVDCRETVGAHDVPTHAIRRKKDSSLVVGLSELKERKIDAFVTAGNTGAVLAGGLFVVGRIKGISRPAICTIYPTGEKPSVLLDAGANAECKVRNLVEFAMMGSIYAKTILGYEKPSVGLVNIGEESGKGTPLQVKAYEELSKNPAGIHFVGNVEGRDIPNGSVNVIVADGFTGNIILKLTEGIAKELLGHVKGAIMSSLTSKIGGLLIKRSMKELKKKMDYTEYGGAPILGVDGVLIKAHGSSNEKAFVSAIKYAEFAAKGEIVDLIKKEAATLEVAE